MTVDVSYDHERALRALGVRATVTYVAFDRVAVELSADALDELLEGVERVRGLDDALSEAESGGYDSGHEDGHAEGYQDACTDITGEQGDAWDIVKPMLERAFEEGHEAACEEIAELAS